MVAGERAGRCTFNISAVHRHAHVELDVTDRRAFPEQGLFKRERATKYKSDEIVTPIVDDVGRLVDDFAVTPDPIARHIGADIEVGSERRNVRAADVGHADDRACFWLNWKKR